MTIGMMYENGQGVEKNEVEAKRWYKLSEENRDWDQKKTDEMACLICFCIFRLYKIYLWL